MAVQVVGHERLNGAALVKESLPMRLSKIFLLFSTVLVLSISTLAQNATTMVHGTVTDPKGGVIPGATVTLVNSAVGYKRDVTSGPDGSYQVLQVPPGTYDVSADAKNVGHVDVKGVRL